MDETAIVDGVDFQARGYFLDILHYIDQPKLQEVLGIGWQWIQQLNGNGPRTRNLRVGILQRRQCEAKGEARRDKVGAPDIDGRVDQNAAERVDGRRKPVHADQDVLVCLQDNAGLEGQQVEGRRILGVRVKHDLPCGHNFGLCARDQQEHQDNELLEGLHNYNLYQSRLLIKSIVLSHCPFVVLISIISMSSFEAILIEEPEERSCTFATYACLEQPETLDYLKYLNLSEPTETGCISLNFNSEGDQNFKTSKKTKKFAFDGIYNRTEKMKHQFSKLINDVAGDALKGQNQTFFIYGTEETCKDKIIFGESQNPGLFLCLLSEIFDLCHKKALEDEVTVKLSCSLFNKAKFKDIFGGNGDSQIEFKRDILEGGILHTVPEIIIRNVKTGLKLLNIISKQLADDREEEETENLILTLKLELDCQRNREQTQIFCLSKISFIKLANPSVNSSLKGVNKNNIWHVNLLNYLQSSALSQHNSPANPFLTSNSNEHEDKEDEFTAFIRESCFKCSHRIFGFISITNKMNSNECLSALLFANHLKNSKSSPLKYIISLPKLKQEREKLSKPTFGFIINSEALLNLWIEYIGLLQTYMTELNYLEFQYSLVIGEACEKLNKYIFTEELEDFFYAKKTNVDKGRDLEEAYGNAVRAKAKVVAAQKKLAQQIGEKVDKGTLQKLFDLEFSLSYHFLYQGLEGVQQYLKVSLDNLMAKRQKAQLEGQLAKQKEISVPNDTLTQRNIKSISNKAQIEAKNPQLHLKKDNSTSKQPSNSTHSKAQPPGKVKKPANESMDNLECMFRNKNVGIGNKKLR